MQYSATAASDDCNGRMQSRAINRKRVISDGSLTSPLSSGQRPIESDQMASERPAFAFQVHLFFLEALMGEPGYGRRRYGRSPVSREGGVSQGGNPAKAGSTQRSSLFSLISSPTPSVSAGSRWWKPSPAGILASGLAHRQRATRQARRAEHGKRIAGTIPRGRSR